MLLVGKAALRRGYALEHYAFPTIGIPGLWSARAVDVMTPFLAALLGLGINQGAYTSEVMRAGLLSVDAGQYEAAQAIGMHQTQWVCML